ncbi:MAG TPA: class I SAM-dependent methyltransferase [Vicinamibacterales bacterium]|nr:class I SAM-dependent methyltransferase [Vicinamibacterales bacterium]
MLPPGSHPDGEQDLEIEKDFYEKMFSGLRDLEDGHCIVYGHDQIYGFLDGVERGTLLEAGCGAGHHGVNLSRRGFEVTSIDLTVNGVRAARALAEHEQQDITYVCGDIKQLPFGDREFDVCFCSLVLHHFVRLDNLLRELSRVTRRCFVAFEVSALDPMSFFRFNVINPTIGISNISRNQRALFPGSLERTLRKNGFDTFVTEYADMHEYLGRAPGSMNARMILAYQRMLSVLPAKYSRNKFLLRADRKSA